MKTERVNTRTEGRAGDRVPMRDRVYSAFMATPAHIFQIRHLVMSLRAAVPEFTRKGTSFPYCRAMNGGSHDKNGPIKVTTKPFSLNPTITLTPYTNIPPLHKLCTRTLAQVNYILLCAVYLTDLFNFHGNMHHYIVCLHTFPHHHFPLDYSITPM